jgi:hypothetical protein
MGQGMMGGYDIVNDSTQLYSASTLTGTWTVAYGSASAPTVTAGACSSPTPTPTPTPKPHLFDCNYNKKCTNIRKGISLRMPRTFAFLRTQDKET